MFMHGVLGYKLSRLSLTEPSNKYICNKEWDEIDGHIKIMHEPSANNWKPTL